MKLTERELKEAIYKMNILNKLIDSCHLKPAELAQRLHISKSYMSMLLSGEREVSKNIAIKLNCEFGIPLDVSLCPQVHNAKTNNNPNPAA